MLCIKHKEGEELQAGLASDWLHTGEYLKPCLSGWNNLNNR